MILDSWENRNLYQSIHPLFDDGITYIEQVIRGPIEPGVYEIKGDNLLAKIQRFDTRDKGFYETHEKYIDLQYMVSGTEKVFYREKKALLPAGEYDADEDVQFFEDCEEYVEFVLTPGRFAVFFPEDAHKPSMIVKKQEKAEKIVLKIKI